MTPILGPRRHTSPLLYVSAALIERLQQHPRVRVAAAILLELEDAFALVLRSAGVTEILVQCSFSRKKQPLHVTDVTAVTSVTSVTSVTPATALIPRKSRKR